MRALTYQGAKDVRMETVPDPILTAKDDLVLRVTATAIAALICTSTAAKFRI